MGKINWAIFSQTIKSYSRFRQFAVTKFVHNQWPLLSREFKWNRSTTPLCPLCNKHTEDRDHVFQCQEPHVRTYRLQQLEALDKTLTEIDTFPLLKRHLMKLLRKYCSNFPVYNIPENPANPDNDCIRSINVQMNFSPQNLLRSVLAKDIIYVRQQYISVYRPKTNNVVYWAIHVTKALHTYATTLWKYRCDIVHNVSQTIMEQHTRKQAKKLFLCLLRDPFKLPCDNRNLLRKPMIFFRTTKMRNLQWWINRINLALDLQSDKMKVGVSDIRDWLNTAKPEVGKMYFLDDDYEYDSDDTRYHTIHFPDEVDHDQWINN